METGGESVVQTLQQGFSEFGTFDAGRNDGHGYELQWFVAIVDFVYVVLHVHGM